MEQGSGGASGAPMTGADSQQSATEGQNNQAGFGENQSGQAQGFGSATGGKAQAKSKGPAPEIAGASESKPKTWKVKVDGKELDMGEDEILQSASLGRAAMQRMREAAELKNKMSAFMENFRKNPIEALEDPQLGLTDDQRREMIENYYKKKYIEPEEMTPEQKELAAARSEIEKYKKVEEDRKQKEETLRRQLIEAKHRQTFEQQIIGALDKGGLPKTPQTAARMAFYMSEAIKAGYEAPIETIVNQVRQDYMDAIRDLTSQSTPESLLKVLGPDIVKRIRQYDVDQWKARRAAKLAQAGQQQEQPAEGGDPAALLAEPPKAKPKARESYSDVLKRFR
jgi:hypothetical protein